LQGSFTFVLGLFHSYSSSLLLICIRSLLLGRKINVLGLFY
jgi:hypothetical protein